MSGGVKLCPQASGHDQATRGTTSRVGSEEDAVRSVAQARHRGDGSRSFLGGKTLDVVDQYGKNGMIEEPTIAMVPVGVIPPNVLTEIGAIVALNLDAKVVVAAGIALSSSAYDVRRGQYHSTKILQTVADVKHEDWERVLGVADVDLYVPDLNFVFGEADMHRGAAVFSLARLRPGGSSEAAKALFVKRAATEAIHELGHTFGLRHCRDPHCVMWFSNTLAESDRKGLAFCAAHASQLMMARRSR